MIDACTRTGRRVPDDISVIGVDNDKLLCPYATVPLSSIDVGLRAVARRAAEMLESQFATGASDHAMVRLANLRVVTRRSTDTVAVADEQVRQALEFIRAKACDRIGVEEVLNVVGLSRATLDRRFLATLGRTVGEEIRRVKATTASRLLRDTDISLVEVARQSGFASQQHLCRAFKIAFNASPGAYRDDAAKGQNPSAHPV